MVKGKNMLDVMFSHPLSSKEEIENRTSLIQYFAKTTQKIKVATEALDFIEYYLTLDYIASTYLFIDRLRRSISQLFKADNEYYVIKRSIKCFAEVVEQ